MKALKLHLKNIGPFRDESVDFTELGDMFLVAGQTGAGKTTIFDAMTYALYGDLAGMRHDARQEFRSDFADPSDEAFVDFTFAINHETYHIHRTLPSVYVNRNGKGAQRPSELQLEKLKADGSGFEAVTGRTSTELQDKISAVIGLSLNEFTQIVLLPQGAFAEFLHENSKDRRDTLAKLFPVDSYERITISAKAKSEEFDETRRTVESQLTELLAHFDAEHAETDIAALDKKLAAAAEKRAELTHTLEELGGRREHAKAGLDAALKSEALQQQKQELDARSDEMAAAERRAGCAEQALKLEGYIRSAATAAERVRNFEEQKKQAAAAAAAAETAYTLLDAQSAEIGKLKTQSAGDAVQLKELDIRLQHLQRTADAELHMEQSETAVHDAERALGDAQDAAQELISRLYSVTGCGEDSAADDDSLVLSSVLEQKQTVQNTCAAAEKTAELASEAYELCREAADAEKMLLEKQHALAAAEKLRDSIQCCLADYTVQQKLREQNNYACALAVVLKDGAPCPVCGATEHPHPVIPLTETLDVADKILTQQKLLAEQDEKLSQLRTGTAAAEALVFRQKKELAEKTAACPVTKEQADAALAAVRKELVDAEKIYAQAVSLSHTLKEKRIAVRQLTETLQTAKQKYAAASAAHDVCMKDSIPGETCDVLAEKIKILKAESDARLKKCAQYDADLGRADRALAACKERLHTLEDGYTRAVKDSQTAEHELELQTAGSPFADAEEARAACMSAPDLEALRNTITAWNDAVKRVAVQIESVPVSAGSKELQQKIEALEHEIDTVHASVAAADDEVNGLTARRTVTAENSDRRNSLERQRKELYEKSEHYIKLADDLQGKNPKRIPFDAWILGMYFSEVVELANPRFARISGGRYRFLIAADASGGNSLRGLDLRVSDSYTGRIRDTATLSGGETFMASISLALALTDVVQNQSGGVRLDSLFIDEGFGSLDGDALDKSISILQDIRESRTVGIISHVEGLRTVIPACLEVVKGVNGSHVSIHGSAD